MPVDVRPVGDGLADVTFRWHGTADRVGLHCGLAPSHAISSPMQRDGDEWSLTITARDDALVSYRYVPDDPILTDPPVDDSGWIQAMLDAQRRAEADVGDMPRIRPLAALFVPGLPEASWESILALPHAPDASWFEPHDAPESQLSSIELGAGSDARPVTVQVPATGDTAAGLPLVVLFDGSSFVSLAELPRAIDLAIHRREIEPCVVAYVHERRSARGFDERNTELSCNDDHAKLIATDLVPRLRQDFAVTSDPDRTVLGGASLGGLQSMHTAMAYPEVIGAVLSVSGSFWYGTERDGLPEWTARRLAVDAFTGTRIYQQIGRLEDHPLAASPGVSHLVANRHFRDVARAKGHDLHYDELTTAHDVAAFRVAVMRGLRHLLPAAP